MLRSPSSWPLAVTLLLALPGCYLSDDYSSGSGAVAGQSGVGGKAGAGGSGGVSGSAGRGGSAGNAGSAGTAGKAGAGGGTGGKAGAQGGNAGAGAGGTLSYAASCAAIVDCDPNNEGQLEQQCLAGEKCNQQVFAPEATKQILGCLAKRACDQPLGSCFSSFSAASDVINSARDKFAQSCGQRAKECEAAAEIFDQKLCAIPPVFRAEIFLKMADQVGGAPCSGDAVFLQDFLKKYVPECGAFSSDFWIANLGL